MSRFNPFAGMGSAPVASDSSRPTFESPQSAIYVGQSDSYSSFHSPLDESARMNLLHVESQRASFDASMAEQSSIYTPEAASKGGYKHHAGKGKGRQTVLRKGGGELWEDASLMEWDPSQSNTPSLTLALIQSHSTLSTIRRRFRSCPLR